MENSTWLHFFAQENEKLYFRHMMNFIEQAYQHENVFPQFENVFKAFALTPLDRVKVVILGQDPYHQPGQAMGLAFSVPNGVKIPPSLLNIYKEIQNDLNVSMDFSSGDLTYLAEQGVLLFNPIFTVEQGRPLSHDFPFYREFTLQIFKRLSHIKRPIVYVLWGKKAQKMEKYIHNENCLVIKTNHPSPLSANRGGFFGLHQFSTINQYLINNNLLPIRWQNK